MPAAPIDLGTRYTPSAEQVKRAAKHNRSVSPGSASNRPKRKRPPSATGEGYRAIMERARREDEAQRGLTNFNARKVASGAAE